MGWFSKEDIEERKVGETNIEYFVRTKGHYTYKEDIIDIYEEISDRINKIEQDIKDIKKED